MSGELPLAQAGIKIAFTTVAGLASYRLARLIWSLDLIEDHHERFYEVNCSSDLQVALLTGVAIEMAATLSDTWLGLQTVSSTSVLDEFVKYLNAALMIVFGELGHRDSGSYLLSHEHGRRWSTVEALCIETGSVQFSVALRPQRQYGLLGMGSPGRPPRLSHSS